MNSQASKNSSRQSSDRQGSVRPGSGASNWPSSSRGSGERRSRVTSGKRDWSVPSPPPYRAYRPVGRVLHRPALLPGYHPRVGCPVISAILGVTFGTMYLATLDYLQSMDYEIDGYDGNTIYLRNVRELGFNWPDAVMYYDDAGQLAGAQFSYSTSLDSPTRFNRLYSDLCETYGDPMSDEEQADYSAVTWYGGDEQGYVTLEYQLADGRYYTILSYGI